MQKKSFLTKIFLVGDLMKTNDKKRKYCGKKQFESLVVKRKKNLRQFYFYIG